MSRNQVTPHPLFDNLQNWQIDPTHPQWFDRLPKEIMKPGLQEYSYVREFLYSYRGSEATFNAYRRELERLMQWSWLVVKKPICQLRRTDIEAFIEFCQRPPLHWIGINNVPRFLDKEGMRIPNSVWRPFVVNVSKVAHQQGEIPDPKKYSLSQKALQAIFAVLGSFYNYLIQEEHIAFNPVAQIRQKSKFLRKQQTQTPIRRLTNLQWDYVIATAEQMAGQNPLHHERTLFIMNALYGMYLRISELASSERWAPKMSDFFRDMDGNWWFKTVGKGNKERIVSVSNAMLGALKRYRVSMGLNPLPYPGETTPLLPKNRGSGSISSTRQIRTIVQLCFDTSMQKMNQDGFVQDAELLKAATVHWLRHTGISEDVKIRPREHVRDDAGHGSSAITDKYIDVELRERHASAKHKQIKPAD